MRILTGCLVLFVGALAIPQQSSVQYHSLYGQPDVERYSVRPGISLTVQYGSDGVACRMLISAPSSLYLFPYENTFISTDTVEEILNDVVPLSVRGAKIRDEGGWQSGPTYNTGVSYEHVIIGHLRHGDCAALHSNCEVGASVNFKRAVCDDLPKSRVTMR